MSYFLLSILERHNLPPIYSLPAHLFTFHSSWDTSQPAKVSLMHLQELKNQLKQEMVCEGRRGEHCTHSNPLGPGKEQCWPAQDSRQHRGSCSSTAGESGAVWDNAGAGGALWHEEQRCLTDQFGDMRVVKLLHAGSLSQELLNVSGGEDVSWKKGPWVFFLCRWLQGALQIMIVKSLLFVTQYIFSDL